MNRNEEVNANVILKTRTFSVEDPRYDNRNLQR